MNGADGQFKSIEKIPKFTQAEVVTNHSEEDEFYSAPTVKEYIKRLQEKSEETINMLQGYIDLAFELHCECDEDGLTELLSEHVSEKVREDVHNHNRH